MTRSPYLLRFFAVLLISVVSAFAHAGETLRVLTWPGYADADLVRGFEQRTGAQVEVTLIDTAEAIPGVVHGDKTPFQLVATDCPAAVQPLIALRRNALTFYTQPEESVAAG